jgi:hypothetical protein
MNLHKIQTVRNDDLITYLFTRYRQQFLFEFQTVDGADGLYYRDNNDEPPFWQHIGETMVNTYREDMESRNP